MEDDLPIEHPWITKSIASAQKKVEGHNYDIRKHLLEYDDVMNQQRKVVYAWRREVLGRENLREMVFSMTEELVNAICEDFFPGGKLKKTDGSTSLNEKELNEAIAVTFQVHTRITENDIQPLTGDGLRKLLMRIAEEAYSSKENQYSPELMRQVEKMVLLGTIDHLWKDHLLAMDHLRDGIGLQGYGQKDPLVEYKKQGFRFFEMMMAQITGDVVRKLFAVQISANAAPMQEEHEVDEQEEFFESAPASNPASARLPSAREALTGMKPLPPGTDISRIGRNDECPCKSGKKFKKCHGANL
jgi:preprotein translocase subunit SecA